VSLTRYRFDKACRALPLLEELHAAGIAAGAVFPWPDHTEVDLDPADHDAAVAVVAAHDVAAVDAAEEAARQAKAADVATVDTHFQAMADYLAGLADPATEFTLDEFRASLLKTRDLIVAFSRRFEEFAQSQLTQENP
jgi:acyl-CoA reductase-like NAD-dependent aldehyde dehydrogenase